MHPVKFYLVVAWRRLTGKNRKRISTRESLLREIEFFKYLAAYHGGLQMRHEYIANRINGPRFPATKAERDMMWGFYRHYMRFINKDWK